MLTKIYGSDVVSAADAKLRLQVATVLLVAIIILEAFSAYGMIP